MKISRRDKKTNEEVLKLADEQLYIIPTIKKKNHLLWSHDQTKQHPQAAIGGSTGGETKQRKAKNGVVDKHHSMDGNAIRRPRETRS